MQQWPSMCVLDYCHVGKVHDNQGHGVMVASFLSISALMQPHRRTLPPSCFTVGAMHFSLHYTPLRRHTVLRPSVPTTFLVPSLEYRSPSSLLLFQHGPWQILGGLFCAWAFGEASFMDNTHACHSTAVYTVLCHGKQSPQFGFLFL
ncbi:unnamed protein product [Staurois parvus]|uniref:Uncharacterized protein n=1 Tax=Staurois parvus TaxID=386267 RepID=A0ABN9H4I5_9NEOB|nr:unnamed protein product [Staurois parvus]